MSQRIRVGVVFGGRSGEHEVSLASARSVITAMDKARYEVVPVGITREGRWVLLPDLDSALSESLDLHAFQPVMPLVDPTQRGVVKLNDSNKTIGAHLDVIFPVLHGPMGEDGTIQGLFELAQIPYVGAGVLGSAVGMDKIVMKILFHAAGLPGPDYELVRRVDWQQEPGKVRKQLEERFHYPFFVKPANLGSSVGISKVHNPDELSPGLNLASSYDRRIIVEEGITGAREIEVSVLGNDYPEASVPGEIIPSKEFYDYEAKYVNENSKLLIPAPIPEDTMNRIREMAVKAFQAVDCAGMARVDFFYLEHEDKILVNEINTIPGFTKISMYPKLWEASGLPYAKLIDRLIELALERHGQG